MANTYAALTFDTAAAAVTEIADVPDTRLKKFSAFKENNRTKFTVVALGEGGCNILTYSMPQQTGGATIGTDTIAIEVTHGTDVTALVATFTLSTGARHAKVLGVTQVSATTQNNFTLPVVYVVTAQNGTKKNWTVTVTVA